MNDEQLVKPHQHEGELASFPATFHVTPALDREDHESRELGLHAYLRIIRKHAIEITLLTIVCTSLTAWYMARKADLYGAQARVQIDLENNPAIGAGSNSVVISNPANAPDYFETQIEILRGSGLLRRVVKTLDLEHNRQFFKTEGQRTTWQRLKAMAGFANSNPAQVSESAERNVLITTEVAPPTDRENLAEIKRLNPYVGAIQGGLEVEQVGHTRLVAVRFVHQDPQIAAKVVNAIADTFVLSNLEKMTESNAGAAAFLKKRVADLQAQIRNGEERLLNYSRDHQILSLNDNQNTVIDRLNGLSRELLAAESQRYAAETAYRAALAPGAADALAGNTASQSAVETKLAELRLRLAQLKSEYTDKWPEVRTVQEQIAELENQLGQSKTNKTETLLKALEAKYNEALQREQTIRAAFERQRNETISQNSAAVNYRIIQQEIQTNQELLNGLWQRSKQNDVILAGTPNNIRVADYANTPESPIGPHRTRGVGLAFAFSLAFGIGLVLLRELTNSTVRTTADVSRKLRLPTLAVVPRVGGWVTTLPAPRLLLPKNRRSFTDRPLLISSNSDPRLAEIYRKLRTTLILTKPGKAHKTLLITSSIPAEGKTTTAVNIATILAQTGATVLIIDADLRQPRLHHIFHLHNDKGLGSLLENDFSEARIHEAIQLDVEAGVSVLTAGPQPSRPAELLATDQMRRILDTVSGCFDYIIIDSTPVVSFTDSVLLANLVDGVLLVVQGGKSPHDVIQHARRELQEVGATIFGVVLNNVEATPQDSYYYYYRASA